MYGKWEKKEYLRIQGVHSHIPVWPPLDSRIICDEQMSK